MKINYFEVSAFTYKGKGGNKAAVVLISKNYSDKILQKIAKKIGFSETAFVFLNNFLKINVRFFTPEKEVDYCGHASLAVAKVLKNRFFNKSYELVNNQFVIITKAGNINITLAKDGKFFISQKLPKFLKIINKKEISELFYFSKSSVALKDNFLITKYPFQVVNTGLSDLIIFIKNHDLLLKLNPDFNKISALQRKYNLDGIHIFTLEKGLNSKIKNIYSRNFSPLLGIPEESATGSATGSLLCYLYKYNIISTEVALEGLNFIQGENLKQKSLVFAYLNFDKNDFSIKEVNIGGDCIIDSIKQISI